MSLTRDEALRRLDLGADPDPATIEHALLERVARIERLATAAGAESLRAKYRAQLEELEQARQVLLVGPKPPPGLTQTMLGDLPVAEPGGPGAAAGFAPGVEPGRLLAGRYEVVERIGAGSMGVVYRARDRTRDADVALKLLLPRLLSSPSARARFLEEARLSSELSHPNIVNVYDVHQDGPHTFLSMELLRGRTLRAELDDLRRRRATMPLATALGVARQLADALEHAHRRTVHRDIKPENIWLTEDGQAKLMDFGVARLLAPGGTSDASLNPVVGTAYYMAPEQLRGEDAVDARADQYGLAATLYEMLVGQVPSGRVESPERLRREVPPEVAAAVMKALSSRATDRFDDISAFRQALQPTPGSRLRGAWRRQPAVWAGVAALLLAWPAWKLVAGMMDSRAAEAAAQVEAARLQGEARSLLRLVDAQRSELRDAAQQAQRELERLEGEVRGARDNAARSALWADLIAAQDQAAQRREVEATQRALLEGPQGLAAIEGRVNVGEASLKGGDATRAASVFGEAVQLLGAARDTPARQQAAWRQQRERQLAALAGAWAAGDCAGAASWTTEGARLRVQWPGQPAAEARLLSATASEIAVVVEAPASQQGRVYRYQRAGQELTVLDLMEGRRAVLKACSP